MKILSLQFENLNSLKGSWVIDFQDKAFIDNGLFVITGQTGAGKSTLLDAICLALYQQTPRLDKLTQSNNELMTRGTAHCSAQVEFSVKRNGKSKSYRVSWAQSRARKKSDGRLQAPICELAELDGTILATKSSEVLKLVISLTGLDFSRFTKSMLLAQGGFAAFLNASPKDRAELLEELTGTEIYAQISQHIFERNKEVQAELALLTSQSALLELLSEADLAILQTDIIALQSESDKKRNEIKSLEKALQWQADALRLSEQLKATSTAHLQAEQALDDFAPQSKKIQQALQAQPILPHFVALTTQQKLSESNQKEINEHTEQLTKLQQLLLNADKTLSTLLVTEQQALKKHKLQMQRLTEELIPMDSKISALENEYTEKVPYVEQQKQIQQQAKKAVITLEEQIKEKKITLQRSQETLLKQQSSTIDAEKIAMLEHLLLAYSQESKKSLALTEKTQVQKQLIATNGSAQQQINQVIENNVAQLKQVNTSLTSFEEHKARLSMQIGNNANEKLNTLYQRKESLSRLLQLTQSLDKSILESNATEQTIADKKTQFEQDKLQLAELKKQGQQLSLEESDLKTLIKQDSLLRSVQDLQLQLEKDSPCPLCGSLEHPAVTDHQAIDLESTEQRLQQKSEALIIKRGQYEQLNGHLKALNLQINDLQIGYTRQISEIGDLKKAWVKSDYCESEALIYDNKSSLLLSEKALVLDSEITTLSSLVKELHAIEQQNLPLQQQHTALNEQLTAQQQQLKDVINEHKLLLSSAEQTDEQLIVVQNALAQLNTDISDKLAGTSDLAAILLSPETWLTAQKQAIAQCELLANQLATLTESVTQLTQQLGLNVQQLAHDETRLAESQKQLQLIVKEKNNLSTERIKLFTEQTSQQLQVFYDVQLQAVKSEVEKAKQQVSTVKLDIEGIQGIFNTLNASKITLATQLKEAMLTFELALNKSEFTTVLEFETACLSHQALALLQSNASTLKDNLLTEKTKLDGLQKQQSEHHKTKNSTLDTQQLQDKLTQLQAEYAVTSESLIAQSSRLKMDQSNQQKQKQLQQQQIEFKQTAGHWELLNKLIGQADGSKFRKFAQGLTLDNLIHLANREMAHLDQRYQLKRNVDEELALQVIDCWQANSVRDVKTLSGGESFLVSLGLALALSNLVSHKTQIESLFLDEGFGTLDENTLSMALDALERLNSTGKLIGIISHVDALKERINHQIHVHKNSGAGYSVLDKQYMKG
ncbi:nuclease SbcCD subunit C [Psychromonas marina]|uniref:Nuclease SbcCD subunit C n=1 Tax=Psychromonas marina TaxID=88364 RepID=A0ABQ6DXJ6_9GAMM|nr:SbcC/MukB-like Walker B domain-containing protein [Psychromonas marina]GLS89868.1 nuclease SbcCD subunit C [Psychromonas marina]